jgi:hypothetical protein
MWGAWIKTLETTAAQHREMYMVMTHDVGKDLASARADDVAQLLAKGNVGKKVLRDLKVEDNRVVMVWVWGLVVVG